MFLQLFHITVAAAYFFCSYSGLTGAFFLSTLSDKAFIPLKNSSPSSTYIVAPSLSKHIYTHSEIKIESDDPVIWVNDPPRFLLACNSIISAESPLKILLESPLNKAPPLSLS